MIKKLLHSFFFLFAISLTAQDTANYRLRLDVPLVDFPQNTSLPYKAPSMDQALKFSYDLYDISYWGIDKLGDKIFVPKTKPNTKLRKFSNAAFKFGVGLAFSFYGSELPIPLGVWGHEEFHRAVLGVNKIDSKNGNWILHRWDGTVYGVSDSTLSQLKRNDVNELLYSYVSGVQYEVALNEKITLQQFYKSRTLSKNSLMLYNAYYVFNYFRFSTGALTDSVKKLAPPHENKLSHERDFAGADLTAWAYDMFNPQQAYIVRDSFPNGEGVNRRVGFSDLSPEAQAYLKEQKNLSLLNFINPSLFFVNRIRVNSNFAFNLFTQYAPTHFGNDIALFVPLQYKQFDVFLNLHQYTSRNNRGYGIGLGLYNFKITPKLESDITLNVWEQPSTFYGNNKLVGGSLGLKINYYLSSGFSAYVSGVGKTDGWMLGNPYLKSNVSAQIGLNYNLAKK